MVPSVVVVVAATRPSSLRMWPGGRVRRRQLHVHTPSVVYRG